MLMNGSAMAGGITSSGGGIDGGRSPPPPAPSTSSPPSAGVIVQVGPGSNSSTNSASSTPTSLFTSPVTTPPTPAPSSSTTFQSLFGVNPLAFPAFSSNVTLTSNHVRAGSQDAAFVPNSPSTNITLPVIPPLSLAHQHHQYHHLGYQSNHNLGMAPLAILSSPSLGSTPTSPLFSPSSSSAATSPVGIGSGIVNIDVAPPTTMAISKMSGNGASSLLLPSATAEAASSTLPSSSSSCVISSSSSASAAPSNIVTSFPVMQSSHMNSNAISAGTCSLNQSIAAGGIVGISQQFASSPSINNANATTIIEHCPVTSTGPPLQHCLLVSCNPPSSSSANLNLINSEVQTDNNQVCEQQNTSTISIAPPPPPPSRSREHRKRERRERRRDRSYRSGANTGGSNSNTPSSSSRGQGHSSSTSSYHHHNNHHGGGGNSSSSSRHHNHHHHGVHRVKSSSTSFNGGNGNSTVNQNQSSSSGSNLLSGGGSASNSNLCGSSSALAGDELIISEVQSERGDRLSVVGSTHPATTITEGSLILGPPPPSQSPLAGMPDLLDSHFPPAPPPYSTLPHHASGHPMPMGAAPVPIQMIPSPVPVPLMPPPPPPTLMSPASCIPAQPVRYHFTTTAAAARVSRRSMRTHRGVPYASEEEPKTCCGMSASQAVSIRWFIIVIAVIGICCTLAGTALGAARSAGKEHLTLSLLMIGVGVLLLTVSAVAWRLTANESGSSCRAMLGFARSGSSRGDGGSEPNRRFVPRLPPSYGRPHHPYAAMMYPEFQYRQPPPSYQASMQEYRLRLLLLERSNPTIAAFGSSAMVGHGPVMVPPPPYRPYSANMRMLPHARVDDYSRPPSYRSRSSGNNTGEYGTDGSPGGRPSLDPSVGHNHHSHPHHHHHIIESPMHSRDPSLLSYLSQQSVDNMSVVSGHVTNHHHHGNPATTTATVVTVVQAVSVGMDIGLGSTLGPPYDADDDGKGLPSLEGVDDKSCYDPEERDNKDGNMVRIVQTTDSSQVIGRDSVIVTVSGGGGPNGLWDYHHLNPSATSYAVAVTSPPALSGTSNNVITTTTAPSSTSERTDRDQPGNGGGSGGGSTSEVQILAHL